MAETDSSELIGVVDTGERGGGVEVPPPSDSTNTDHVVCDVAKSHSEAESIEESSGALQSRSNTAVTMSYCTRITSDINKSPSGNEASDSLQTDISCVTHGPSIEQKEDSMHPTVSKVGGCKRSMDSGCDDELPTKKAETESSPNLPDHLIGATFPQGVVTNSKVVVDEAIAVRTSDTNERCDGEINLGEEMQEEILRYDDADFSQQPRYLTGAWSEFKDKTDNFLKGCKWSPDGLCVLTNSGDKCLRLFDIPRQVYEGDLEDIPEMHSVVQCQEGELVYDYDWYPLMNSDDPNSSFFVSTSRNTPIHMWDAHTGTLRSSYRAYDQMDEITAAHSLAFSPNGKRLYAGFNKMIRVFDVDRPGRSCENRPTYVNHGQSGIINCMAVNPANQSMYAAGSFNRTVAVYNEPNGDMMCMFEGQLGGVTHLQFSPDGNKLYSGGRKDAEIICWDMRNPGDVLFTMQRTVSTNQRIYFHQDASGRYIASGNHSGTVSVWDTAQPTLTQPSGEQFLPPSLLFCAHDDTVNGISINPIMPLMVTTSGRRHFDYSHFDSDSDSESDNAEDFSLKLWWMANQTKGCNDT